MLWIEIGIEPVNLLKLRSLQIIKNMMLWQISHVPNPRYRIIPHDMLKIMTSTADIYLKKKCHLNYSLYNHKYWHNKQSTNLMQLTVSIAFACHQCNLEWNRQLSNFSIPWMKEKKYIHINQFLHKMPKWIK